MLAGLGIQFVLGMYTNLFVVIPRLTFRHAFRHMMDMSMAPILMVHMMLGLALAIGATIVLFMRWSKQDGTRRLAIVAWAAVFVAGYGGVTFFLGGHQNSDSFLMAVGWLLAVGTYGIMDV